MATELTRIETQVAEEYCKGLTDKEVADNLCKSVWTIKTQKQVIYRKLGINKDTELVLYMFAQKMKVNFEPKELHKHGLELFFSVLFLIMQVTCNDIDMLRRVRTPQRARTSMRYMRAGRKNSNDIYL